MPAIVYFSASVPPARLAEIRASTKRPRFVLDKQANPGDVLEAVCRTLGIKTGSDSTAITNAVAALSDNKAKMLTQEDLGPCG